MKNIGIIVAMEGETEHIMDIYGKVINSETIHGYSVSTFNVQGKNIYMIISGIGEIASAAATMLLIERYKVELIINYGLAGGLKGDFAIGDLLIGKEVVHYDMDVSVFYDGAKGQYPGCDSPTMPCDIQLISLADNAAGTTLKKIRIASGDKFISDPVKCNELINDFGCDICDMESAGIYRVATAAGIPTLFIKSVSDSADENAMEHIEHTINAKVKTYEELIAALLKLL